jgi:hypothetical protein
MEITSLTKLSPRNRSVDQSRNRDEGWTDWAEPARHHGSVVNG